MFSSMMKLEKDYGSVYDLTSAQRDATLLLDFDETHGNDNFLIHVSSTISNNI